MNDAFIFYILESRLHEYYQDCYSPLLTPSQTTRGETYNRESRHLTFIARKPQMAKNKPHLDRPQHMD